MCKLYYFVQMMAYTASISILTVISIERYVPDLRWYEIITKLIVKFNKRQIYFNALVNGSLMYDYIKVENKIKSRYNSGKVESVFEKKYGQNLDILTSLYLSHFHRLQDKFTKQMNLVTRKSKYQPKETQRRSQDSLPFGYRLIVTFD